MRLRHLFLILAALLASVWILLLVQAPLHDSKIFYITEVVTLVCLLFLIYFYRKVVKPMNSIANGMELLHEQDFSSKLSSVGQPEADQIVEIFNRMMQRIKNERLQLREQNHFLDLLINASPMGVIILDFEQRVTTINPSAIKFIGADENIIGCKLENVNSPLAQEIIKINNDSSQTVRLNSANVYHCSRLTFRDKGSAHPFILIEQMTEEVHRAEKNAYEKVIRMIAHEVNNTICGITSTLDSATEVLQTITPDTLQTDADELCSVMRVCEERGYNMSRFITRFADVVKIPQPVPTATNLNDCVQRCKRFMEHMCREKSITLELRLAEEKIPVSIDTTLFEQVLVNIIKNSVESIGSDGEISITTCSSPASIIIADNGKGISKDVEQQLFSPFFTTKSGGQGIGLIFIREVLGNHGCRYSLRTDSDNLTRFAIFF